MEVFFRLLISLNKSPKKQCRLKLWKKSNANTSYALLRTPAGGLKVNLGLQEFLDSIRVRCEPECSSSEYNGGAQQGVEQSPRNHVIAPPTLPPRSSSTH